MWVSVIHDWNLLHLRGARFLLEAHPGGESIEVITSTLLVEQLDAVQLTVLVDGEVCTGTPIFDGSTAEGTVNGHVYLLVGLLSQLAERIAVGKHPRCFLSWHWGVPRWDTPRTYSPERPGRGPRSRRIASRICSPR
jgi:hypothetical protein